MFGKMEYSNYLCTRKTQGVINSNGAWAGRLGNGLQNRVGRFDSARHLKKRDSQH